MAVLFVALIAAVGLVGGCVNSSEEEARTPSDAATVANSALQTDSNGETVTAPAPDAPAGTAGGDGAPAPGGDGAPAPAPGGDGAPAPAGDVAAGQQVFAANCTGCHLNNGQDAGGVGPQLSGGGRDAALVEMTVVNGKGAMPGGLVSGADLENVVAYVVSIQ